MGTAWVGVVSGSAAAVTIDVAVGVVDGGVVPGVVATLGGGHTAGAVLMADVAVKEQSTRTLVAPD
jgi:hypothetical protein